MRPPEQRRDAANLLDLVCDLIEQPRARIGTSFLEARGGEAERLATIGLVRPGSAPRTIACRACDEDHSATPEFDDIARRYFHFCPIAGRVDIEPRDHATGKDQRERGSVDDRLAQVPCFPRHELSTDGGQRGKGGNQHDDPITRRLDTPTGNRIKGRGA
jgi:hypothetical protein